MLTVTATLSVIVSICSNILWSLYGKIEELTAVVENMFSLDIKYFDALGFCFYYSLTISLNSRMYLNLCFSSITPK